MSKEIAGRKRVFSKIGSSGFRVGWLYILCWGHSRLRSYIPLRLTRESERELSEVLINQPYGIVKFPHQRSALLASNHSSICSVGCKA